MLKGEQHLWEVMHMGMRAGLVALAGFLAALGLAVGMSSAADMGMAAAAQLKTAITHAKFSQQYETLPGVKEHLQHVVNCIEGSKGPMFKAMGGNPCQGQGNGLLADAKSAGGKYAGAVAWIELANENAALGLKATSLVKAKAAGWAAQALLEHAEKGMMMK
ncbi:MAG: hypothetical protein A2Z07_09355 [Armatimonadetes bacterium RBG_16_67_12]|nr:MAG: hypothetical protein A2Z07_09355 [Armatimonadetes bacterium RBG_16_67_12]